MDKVLVLSSPLVKRIWGSKYFKNVLGYTNEDELFGEMWAVSALDSAPSIVLNGSFKGMSLKEVYQNNRHLFNAKDDTFPLLVKLIATDDKLSVQVHPDNDYAKKVENKLGKTESWLILSDNEAKIVIGHNAKDENDLRNYISHDDYDSLLKSVEVKRGDFYPILAGTVHAIGANVVLLEIQQSSDVTYRFYDYHRVDANGNERELHLEKAIAVTDYNEYNGKMEDVLNESKSFNYENDYFKIYRIDVNDTYHFNNVNNYLIASVISGEVIVDGIKRRIGESFIVLSDYEISGNGQLIIAESR